MDESIVNSVDSNLFSLFRDIAEANGGRYSEGEHWSFFDLGITVWGNFVFRPRFASREEIGSLKTAILEGRIPNRLMTGPCSVPRNIDEWLEESGFARAGSATGMVIRKENFSYSPKPPEHFEVIEVRKDEEGDDACSSWASLVAEHLFGRAGGEGSEDFRRVIRPRLGSSLRCFLGKVGGIPAGASAMFHDGETAGVYFVAVAPKFRGRGYGYELTAAATNAAFGEGYPNAILQATDMGKSVYRKMGYRELCLLGRFKLPA